MTDNTRYSIPLPEFSYGSKLHSRYHVEVEKPEVIRNNQHVRWFMM